MPKKRKERIAQKSSGGLKRFEDLYPLRKGYTIVAGKPRQACTKGYDFLHVGYSTIKAKECPCCGSLPVFEKDTTDKSVPAERFVAICPHCEMRVDGTGTLEEMVEAWNQRRFTEDTVLTHHRLRDANYLALVRLSDKLVMETIVDAVKLVREKKRLEQQITNAPSPSAKQVFYGKLFECVGELNNIQEFIDTSPMMVEHDPEAVLCKIRAGVYPDMPFEERIKLPLKLVEM